MNGQKNTPHVAGLDHADGDNWRARDGYIALGPHMDEISAHVARLGRSLGRIFQAYAAGNVPQDLNTDILSRWMRGQARFAKARHVGFVLQMLRDARPVASDEDPQPEVARGRIVIDDALISQIEGFIAQTGMGASAMLRGRRHETPRGLSSGMVASWLRGKVKSARKDHVDFMLRIWGEHLAQMEGQLDAAALSSSSTSSSSCVSRARRKPRPRLGAKDRAHYVPVTQGYIDTIHAHRARTGLGHHDILKRYAAEKPDMLDAVMVHGWLNKRVFRADPAHLEFLSDAYARTPQIYMDFDAGKQAALLRLSTRTGTSPMMVLRGASDVPDGLDAPMIARWVGRYPPKKIRLDFYQYFVALCEKRIDILAHDDGQWVELTPPKKAELRALRDRCGVQVSRLLRAGSPQPPPVGLRPRDVHRWLADDVPVLVLAAHYYFVLSQWEYLNRAQ